MKTDEQEAMEEAESRKLDAMLRQQRIDRITELEVENKELREALEGMMKGQLIEDGVVTIRSGPHTEDILRAAKALSHAKADVRG